MSTPLEPNPTDRQESKRQATRARAGREAPLCPLCGSHAADRLADALRAGLESRYRMFPHRCLQCSMVYLHPSFTPEEEAEFYRSEFRAVYHGQGYDLESFHRRGGREARRRAERLERAGLLRGRVLEIGCATGYFLEETKLRKPVRGSIGVEPDEAQRRFARKRGIDCVRELEDIRDGGFDLIVMFHVLEHLADPVATLRELGQRLGPGAALVVEVPNVDDALLDVYEIPEYRRFYWHPAHRLYFSKSTLEAAATRAGLKAKVEPVQRYSLSNHLHWAVRRAPGGQDWLKDLFSEETERAYAEDLCRAFACDTLWMVAHRSGA